MNLRDQRKKYYASVRKILIFWDQGGINSVEKLLLDTKTIIEPNSWAEIIKKLIEQKKLGEANSLIKSVYNKFNNYDYDEKESTEGA